MKHTTDRFVHIIEEVANGNYSDEIHEFTREEYDDEIRRIAEAVGMLMVKVEIREHRLSALLSDLKSAYLDTIHRLVLAAEFKDEDTGEHIQRIGRYSALMAEKIGQNSSEVENILYAAPMHDIGKIGIPDHILMAPRPLVEEEYRIMKTHTTIGGKLLDNSGAELLLVARVIALSHHERFDGSGYPFGLTGEDIPLAGRIVSLADVFDALTSRRPYKEPHSLEYALSYIEEQKGKRFDPALAQVFLDNIDQILAIKAEVSAAVRADEEI